MEETAEKMFRSFMIYTCDENLTLSQNKRICKDCCIEVADMIEELMFDFAENPVYTKKYWQGVKSIIEQL